MVTAWPDENERPTRDEPKLALVLVPRGYDPGAGGTTSGTSPDTPPPPGPDAGAGTEPGAGPAGGAAGGEPAPPAHPWVFPFFFQAEDGIRDLTVTGVQTCALPI